MVATRSPNETEDVLFESHPSLRPTVAAIFVVAVGTFFIGGVLVLRGTAFIGDAANTIAGVVVVLGVLLLLRYLGRLYVLRRTSYVLTDQEIRREFAFLLVRSSREIPIHQLRGVHLSQSPLQRLLGYGTVEMLTVGSDQSLGFVAFENISAPEERRDDIRLLLREQQSTRTAEEEMDNQPQ